MPNNSIAYKLTEDDRKSLSASFGVAAETVPTKVSGGQLDDGLSGVLFLEMIGGHRIALRFEGRPMLASAASAALAQRHPRAA